MSVKEKLKEMMHSKNMLPSITLASFLESTVVPIPLEALLVPLMQKRREKLWLIALMATMGCLLGAVLFYFVGYFLFGVLNEFIMQYMTTDTQFNTFQDRMQKDGFWFIFSAGLTPVPLQIAMLAAGVTAYSLPLFVLAIAFSRTIRYFGLALMVYYFGNKTEALIKQYKWQTSVLTLIIVVLIWYIFLYK